MDIRDSKLAVVNFLNNIGYVILEIQERYYIVKQFEEASSSSWKHSLTGKDVTSIVNNYLQINGDDSSKMNEITNSLEKIQQCKKFFHKEEKFTLHLS